MFTHDWSKPDWFGELPAGGKVYFWPTKGYPGDNSIEAKNRAATLFGSARVVDPLGPLDTIKSEKDGPDRASAFKLVPSEFLLQAKSNAPLRPKAAASAFSQWIYSLYSNNYGSEEDREHGKAMEQHIFERRRLAASCNDNDFLNSVGSSWSLIHNGLHLQGDHSSRYLEIDHLRINGEALRASPDLLYYNESSAEVIIVEIKHSRLPIPTNLWPNVWGQLWCYSQLEIARSARKLTVVGEVWGENRQWTGRGEGRVEGEPVLFLRASVRRDPRSPAYDRFFRKLFHTYCGGV